ncbi:hypothetical protein EJO69_11040 [Flaviflexus salsibiostraticola]|uniref:Uncharacterized protein n=1 Tax=Flaviflexus salsibiostraticola TaxID=1282737 RepID=A0A3S8ZBC4_9ACTO|nr:hypothetical protein [Flaviflexus salsibiostraticola]AZN30774.1 hypothetical protein EJO69_11040 [Flaviflexus salsibiostraticola]
MNPSEHERDTRQRRLALTSVGLGVLSLLDFLWLLLITATSIAVPEWARIAGVWLMPIGIIGAGATGEAALRGTGRPWAIVGLSLAILSFLAAALLIFLWPT